MINLKGTIINIEKVAKGINSKRDYNEILNDNNISSSCKVELYIYLKRNKPEIFKK